MLELVFFENEWMDLINSVIKMGILTCYNTSLVGTHKAHMHHPYAYTCSYREALYSELYAKAGYA